MTTLLTNQMQKTGAGGGVLLCPTNFAPLQIWSVGRAKIQRFQNSLGMDLTWK